MSSGIYDDLYQRTSIPLITLFGALENMYMESCEYKLCQSIAGEIQGEEDRPVA